jgi:hypothetical protein
MKSDGMYKNLKKHIETSKMAHTPEDMAKISQALLVGYQAIIAEALIEILRQLEEDK